MRTTPSKPSASTQAASLPPDTATLGDRVVVAGLCLMVVGVPLVLWQGLYQYELLPKRLGMHLGIALCCAGWILRGRQVQLPSRRLLLPALCWMAVSVLAAVATTHLLDTSVELVNQATLLALFLVVASTTHPADLRPVWWAAVLTGAAVAVIGMLQYHGLAFLDIPASVQPSATFANRNLAAEYLICVVPVALWLFADARTQRAVLSAGFSMSLMTTFLVYTRTRGAWLGIIGAVLTAAVLLVLRPALRHQFAEDFKDLIWGPKRRWLLLFAALTLTLSALPPHGSLLGGGPAKGDVTSTLSSIIQVPDTATPQKDNNVWERLTLWRGTLRLIADHPVLGVGPGGWIRAYPPYDGGGTVTAGGYNRRPHNDYLWIAAESGLLGLGAYLWFLAAVLLQLFRLAQSADIRIRSASFAFGLSLLSLLIAAFFGFPREQPYTTLFPFLLFGAIAAMAVPTDPQASVLHSRKKAHHPAGSPATLLRWLPYLCLALSLTAVELTRRYIAFDRHYYQASQWAHAGKNWPTVISEAEAALGYGTFVPDILYLKAMALHNLERHAEAEAAYRQLLALAPNTWYAHEGLGLICLQQNQLPEALAHLKTAVSICPSASYNWRSISTTYQQMGRLDLAEQEFRRMVERDPGNAEMHVNLGEIFQLSDQLDSAATHYEHALELNPGLATARTSLTHVLLQKGRFPEALDRSQETLQLHPEDPDAQLTAGLALEALGRRPEAERLYRQLLASQPLFTQAHLALANLLFAQSQYQEALDLFRSFLAFSPADDGVVRLAQARIAQCQEQLRR